MYRLRGVEVWLFIFTKSAPIPIQYISCDICDQTGFLGEGLWLWLLPLVTGDRWQVTPDMNICLHIFFEFFFVFMLLSAHFKMFSVSGMQNFHLYYSLLLDCFLCTVFFIAWCVQKLWTNHCPAGSCTLGTPCQTKPDTEHGRLMCGNEHPILGTVLGKHMILSLWA